MIQYVTGDATQPSGDGPKIIVHVCNDVGGWGAGFVLALSKRWGEPERAYLAWSQRESPLPLGDVQIVSVAPDLYVANLIGQRDVVAVDGVPPVRYDAIRAGLEKVAQFAQENGASAHMPRIGCGLAGGEWAEVERIINEELIAAGVATTVYDLPKR